MPIGSTLARLFALPQTELPLVSLYADLTPELDARTRGYGGPDPEAPRKSWRRKAKPELGPIRPGVTQARDLLRDHAHLFGESGPEWESYRADEERIIEYLEKGEFENDSLGVAIFACHGAGIWMTEELAVAVETRLHIGDKPMIYPLVRVRDDYVRFALVITDSEKARIYVAATGKRIHEDIIEGKEINRTEKGGWSQKRYQQRVDNAVINHVRDVCDQLERLATDENLQYIVLGGHAPSIDEYKRHLSKRAWEKVIAIRNLDADIEEHQAIRQAMQMVRETEEAEGRDLARQAKDEVLAGNLGAAGEEAVRYALEQGAVDTLLLYPNYATVETREELTEMAVQSSASVEFVEDSDDLKRMGGVAAILRWRPYGLPVPKVVAELIRERDESNLPDPSKALAA